MNSVYLSIPIRLSKEENERYGRLAQVILEDGAEVVTMPPIDKDYRTACINRMQELMTMVGGEPFYDTVVMCNDWAKSRQCKTECEMAKQMGIKIVSEGEWKDGQP
jgi:hypothetical protein